MIEYEKQIIYMTRLMQNTIGIYLQKTKLYHWRAVKITCAAKGK